MRRSSFLCSEKVVFSHVSRSTARPRAGKLLIITGRPALSQRPCHGPERIAGPSAASDLAVRSATGGPDQAGTGQISQPNDPQRLPSPRLGLDRARMLFFLALARSLVKLFCHIPIRRESPGRTLLRHARAAARRRVVQPPKPCPDPQIAGRMRAKTLTCSIASPIRPRRSKRSAYSPRQILCLGRSCTARS